MAVLCNSYGNHTVEILTLHDWCTDVTQSGRSPALLLIQGNPNDAINSLLTTLVLCSVSCRTVVREILPGVFDPRSCCIFLGLRAWGCLGNGQGHWNCSMTGLWAETFTHIVFGLLCLPGPMNKARNCEM
jgi:hypothetical protein